LPRIRILDLPKAPKWAGPRTVWNEFGDIEVSGPPRPPLSDGRRAQVRRPGCYRISSP